MVRAVKLAKKRSKIFCMEKLKKLKSWLRKLRIRACRKRIHAALTTTQRTTDRDGSVTAPVYSNDDDGQQFVFRKQKTKKKRNVCDWTILVHMRYCGISNEIVLHTHAPRAPFFLLISNHIYIVYAPIEMNRNTFRAMCLWRQHNYTIKRKINCDGGHQGKMSMSMHTKFILPIWYFICTGTHMHAESTYTWRLL